MIRPLHLGFSPTTLLTLAAVLALSLSLSLHAQEKKLVEWSAKDTTGAPVKVPADGKTSIIIFLLPDQPQSQQAMEIIKAAVQKAGRTQLIAIVSGQDADANAKKLAAESKSPAAFVADPDYTASGKMNVHVWPTTLVIRADGQQVAHLAGMPTSLATELDAYIAFAAGKIDAAAALRQADSQVNVVDSPQQMASRHLAVAQRLLEKGMAEQAKVELSEGLKLQPDNASLQITMAEVLLSTNDGAGAIQLLNAMDNKGITTARTKLLRGRALIALEKWDEAKAALELAIQLNPDPSVAYYELGRVYQHQGQWEQAAQAFRRAFETTNTGQKLAETQPPIPSTTRP